MKGDGGKREEETNPDGNDGDWQMCKMDLIDRSTDGKAGRAADAYRGGERQWKLITEKIQQGFSHSRGNCSKTWQ